MWKYNDELYHYGVLGMKWGVRHFEKYEPKGTKSSNKNNKSKNKSIGWDDDIIIKKGTKAYRVTDDNDGIENIKSFTVDANDRKFYKAYWPKEIDYFNNGNDNFYPENKMHESTYKIKEDLISPSAAKRQKWASELMNDKEVIKEIIYLNHELQYNPDSDYSDLWTMDGDSTKKIANNPEHYTREIFEEAYVSKKKGKEIFSIRLFNEAANRIKSMNEETRANIFFSHMSLSDKLKNIYGKKVVKEHYNMSIDDIGADFYDKNYRINAPIIVYNVNKAMEKIKDKNITKIDQKISHIKYINSMKSIPDSMSEKLFVPNVSKKFNDVNSNNKDPLLYTRRNLLKYYKKRIRR